MKHRLPFLALSILIFSCNAPENKATGKAATEQAESVTEASEKLPEALPQPAKTANPATSSTQPIFTVETGEVREDPESGMPEVDIYLNSPGFEDKVFLVTDMGFQDMEDNSNWAIYGIPAHAEWAFNTWYAGGGYYYYGAKNGQELNVYRSYIDEGTGEGEEAPYELFKTVDLDHPEGKPRHFICYTADNGDSKDLSIAFGQDGKALYAHYTGQSGKLNLQLSSTTLQKGRAYPTTTEVYREVIDDKTNGTYTLTHSGNWDYAEYKTNSGKTFKFTINHDLTVTGNGYRETPCFQ